MSYQSMKRHKGGAGPLAEWLSLCTPLQQPRVSPVRILGVDVEPLIRPCCGGVPHKHNQKDLQLEYPTMYWGALGRRRRKKKRLATDIRSVANVKKKGSLLCPTFQTGSPEITMSLSRRLPGLPSEAPFSPGSPPLTDCSIYM